MSTDKLSVALREVAFAASVAEEHHRSREALLERSALVFAVKTPEQHERAVGIIRDLKRLEIDIENGRKEVGRQILAVKKQFDDSVEEFLNEPRSELARVGAADYDWKVEEDRRLRAEREAQERERQRIERERQAAEAEARRQAEHAARIAREAREAQERAERQATEAKNAEERRRAQEAAAELCRKAEAVEMETAVKLRRITEDAKLVAQHSAIQLERITPSAPVSVEGQRQEMEIVPEVLDHASVYAKFPHAYDLAKAFRISVIKNEIAAGRVTMNNCPPGLRLREELVVRTAAARKPKTKEIEA